MNKKQRQYTGLFTLILCYFIFHEGAHALAAIGYGVFNKINWMLPFGIQIDIDVNRLSSFQFGLFNIVGSITTIIIGWLLVAYSKKLSQVPSSLGKAVLYYITLGFLFIDPVYLSVLYSFFGGGDMNGIVNGFGFSEMAARIVYGGILLVNIVLFIKIVLPVYQSAFEEKVQSQCD